MAELLRRAQGNFDVLLTADRRMQYQQKLDAYGIGVVVTLRRAFSFPCSGVLWSRCVRPWTAVQPGEVLHVSVLTAGEDPQ